MMFVCAFREGRGVVVCINEKIGIKVHGGDMKIRDITPVG